MAQGELRLSALTTILNASVPKGTECKLCSHKALIPCPDCYIAWYFITQTASAFAQKHQSTPYLPIWKRGANTVERLGELQQIAANKPHFFDKWVFVYCEDNEHRFRTRYMGGENTMTSDHLAVLQAGLLTIWQETWREC